MKSKNLTRRMKNFISSKKVRLNPEDWTYTINNSEVFTIINKNGVEQRSFYKKDYGDAMQF